jgi:hypothetical protein
VIGDGGESFFSRWQSSLASRSQMSRYTRAAADSALLELRLFHHAFVAIVVRHSRLIHICNRIKLITLLYLKERLSVAGFSTRETGARMRMIEPVETPSQHLRRVGDP